MAEKTIYSLKTKNGDPVRVEEAHKDANGELLSNKATKVSTTKANTIFVNDGTGNLKDSGVLIDAIPVRVCGGIKFSRANDAGTLIGDYAGLNSTTIMNKWPFSALYIHSEWAREANGDVISTAENKSKFLVMPNAWFKMTANSTYGDFTYMIANYQVDKDYHRFYPGEFSELCISVYFASLSYGYLMSLKDELPVTGMNQKDVLTKTPYFSSGKGDGSVRKAEYLDYRVWACYRVLATIWATNRNIQLVQGYSGVTNYTGNKWTLDDITDEASRYTGVTESSSSIGCLGPGVVSGEIYGTETTAALDWGKRPFKVLGVENPYGFLHQPIYGIYHNYADGDADRGIFAISTESEATIDIAQPGSDYYTIRKKGYLLPNGWQTGFDQMYCFMFPSSSAGGSDTTYVGDYCWNDFSGNWNILAAGGGFARGTAAGLFAIDANRKFDYASPDNGVRLTYERY